MPLSLRQLNTCNLSFRDASPAAIIEWAMSLGKKAIVTTNFGPYEAVLLDHIHWGAPDLPVICVDHGYNTSATYRAAEEISRRLQLNMYYYAPRITRQRREIVFGGVPSVYDEHAHAAFTEEVKLEPFARAFAEHQPEIWFTAIRQEQTAHRASLDILTIDDNTQCLRVAPFFYWSEADMKEYLLSNDLPMVDDYYDPTKVEERRECGLHLPASARYSA